MEKIYININEKININSDVDLKELPENNIVILNAQKEQSNNNINKKFSKINILNRKMRKITLKEKIEVYIKIDENSTYIQLFNIVRILNSNIKKLQCSNIYISQKIDTPLYNNFIKCIQALMYENNYEKYNYIYDVVCDEIDEKFSLNNWCDFKNDNALQIGQVSLFMKQWDVAIRLNIQNPHLSLLRTKNCVST